MFHEAVSIFEVVRRYLCSYKINDASLGRPGHMERDTVYSSEPANRAVITP